MEWQKPISSMTPRELVLHVDELYRQAPHEHQKLIDAALQMHAETGRISFSELARSLKLHRVKVKNDLHQLRVKGLLPSLGKLGKLPKTFPPHDMPFKDFVERYAHIVPGYLERYRSRYPNADFKRLELAAWRGFGSAFASLVTRKVGIADHVHGRVRAFLGGALPAALHPSGRKPVQPFREEDARQLLNDMERRARLVLFARKTGRLNSDNKALVYLLYGVGLAHKQISGVLGISERNSQILLYRARKALGER